MECFSVLMSIYFKEKPENLEACLKSLMNQSRVADEVVIVEDGPISSDLKVVVENFRKSLNIKSVCLSKNMGLAYALNEGLLHCSYDLVARMDSDDICVDNRFEKQMLFMNSNPNISASSGCVDEFNDNEDVIVSRRVLPLNNDDLVEFSKKRSPLSHPAVIFRKKNIFLVGGYPDIYPEDYILWVKLISKGYEIANLPDTLVKMRTGKDFISRRGWLFLKGEIKVYRYMYKIGFLNLFEFISASFLKSLVRLSPNLIKSFLYKRVR